MAKSRSKGKSSQTGRVIPLPPVIYLNDGASTGTPDHALAILKLLPDFKYSAVTQKFSKDSALTLLEATNAGSTVAVCISGEPCASTQIAKHSKTIKKLCIESGRNFLSVNIYKSGSTVPKGGTAQHLNHAVSDTSTPSSTAKDVMEWLFKTLAPIETLHLIQTTDNKNFPEYSYCPVAESRKQDKDSKIQFVAVVTSKPTLSPDGSKLTWAVADKTGIANFYFIHRGSESQYTWDWVLALQPGQRVALPRMPSVRVTEPLAKRAAKAPFRLVGYTLLLPAVVLVAAGKGVRKAGKKISKGKSTKWVPQDDVVVDERGRVRERRLGEKVQSWDARVAVLEDEEKDSKWSVFDEKGMMLGWDSADEDAKTEKGSIVDSK